MVVEDKQIKKRKRVGTLRGSAVTAVELIGGLHLLATNDGGKVKLLAAAPHPAICRAIAMKAEPDCTFLELSKSEQVSEATVESLVPKYTGLTSQLQELLDSRHGR